jgi:hypothetical protein
MFSEKKSYFCVSTGDHPSAWSSISGRPFVGKLPRTCVASPSACGALWKVRGGQITAMRVAAVFPAGCVARDNGRENLG